MLVLPAAGTAAPESGEEAGPPPAPLPQLVFEPGSYDFGLQQVNSNAGQATIQLRNDGEAAAQVQSLDIDGPNAFWIDGGATDCYARTLQPGESCSVRVYFNPYEAVPFTAQLRAGSDGGTTFSANLSGEGGRAHLGAPVDPTNFGSVAVGSDGVTKTIDITNSGNFTGGSFIAVIAGGAVGSFQLLDENCTGIPLSPGATCNVVVNFQPLSSGAKTARLGLFGDSEGGAQITLTGVGVDPEVTPAVGSPGASAAPQMSSRGRTKHRRGKSLRRLRRPRVAVASLRSTH